MVHKITATDIVVLTKGSAWHGLGLIVEDAPSPTDALKLAKLDWEVRQWPLKADDEDTDLRDATHVPNIRSDTLGTLGVVGATFKRVQNVEMAEFCAALGASSTAVQVELAGSIRGGKRVWFLLRGDSILVDGKDKVKPYLLVCIGHDGTLTFPTSRIVVSTTHRIVVPTANPIATDHT